MEVVSEGLRAIDQEAGPDGFPAAGAGAVPEVKASAILDLIGEAAAIVDAGWVVLTANAAALKQAGMVRIVSGRLRIEDSTKQIPQALTAVLQGGDAMKAAPYDGPVRLPAWFRVWAVSLSTGRCGALCVWAASPPAGVAHLEAVTQTFGLTRAESRLACVLAEGFSLLEAAALIGVSHETVRSQLKAIYSKFGLNNQNALVVFLRSAIGLSIR